MRERGWVVPACENLCKPRCARCNSSLCPLSLADDVNRISARCQLTLFEAPSRTGIVALACLRCRCLHRFCMDADALAPGAEMIRVLRVLCREDFSIQSAKMFAADLKMAIDWLDAHFIYTPEQACCWLPMVSATGDSILVGFWTALLTVQNIIDHEM